MLIFSQVRLYAHLKDQGTGNSRPYQRPFPGEWTLTSGGRDFFPRLALLAHSISHSCILVVSSDRPATIAPRLACSPLLLWRLARILAPPLTALHLRRAVVCRNRSGGRHREGQIRWSDPFTVYKERDRKLVGSTGNRTNPAGVDSQPHDQ